MIRNAEADLRPDPSPWRDLYTNVSKHYDDDGDDDYDDDDRGHHDNIK